MIRQISGFQIMCSTKGCRADITLMPARHEHASVNASEIRQRARAAGWVFVAQRHLCPSCRPTAQEIARATRALVRDGHKVVGR